MFKELYQQLKKYHGKQITKDDSLDHDESSSDEYEFPDNDNQYVSQPRHHSKKKLPSFIRSMRTLDKHIKQLEQSVLFIKGKYKYTLLTILHDLKMQYHKDSVRFLHYWNNHLV
jgi:hypothetical protein